MDEESCCICATRLSSVPRTHPETEKPLPSERRLDCCGRVICGSCTHTNARFASYCPYCQIASGPSALPQGLKDPPSYSSSSPSAPRATSPSSPDADAPPPPYQPRGSPPRQRPPSFEEQEAAAAAAALSEKAALALAAEASFPPDTLHFLHHPHDTVASLSLAYGIPAHVLRAANRLSSDGLLAGRRTLLIPGAHNRAAGGASLSPRPVGGEADERRKGKIRRWQVACKEADYDVAVLYLEGAGYDLDEAVERYLADEQWARENPLQEGGGKGKGKGKGKGREGGIWNRASQAAFLWRGGSATRRGEKGRPGLDS